MEVVGRLAGGVAHDFNNLLTPIMGYASMLTDALPPGAPERQYLREIQSSAERGATLTRQLLTFSRHQVIEPAVVDLNDLMLNMERMLRRTLGEDIELVCTPAQDLGMVRVDRGQMEQVLVNMAVNARDAMPRGGRLSVSTADVTLGETTARGFVGLSPGRYVKLSVIDTGIGMGDEVRAHLFEPFFTTKGVGEGTGLGLSICYGIVKQSEGEISVQSEPGMGTTFEIYLPRVDAEPAEGADSLESPDLPRGNETVLLVEDEPSVRRLTAEVLGRQGYTVLEAVSAEEALREAV
jgi:signal transduction histidine kinase